MSKSIPEPLLYSVEGAARAAGVSRRVIRRLIAEGELPIRRVGLLVRIRREDLHAWAGTSRAEVNA